MHSPFVYDLITKCFYDKTTFETYQKLENYRTSLLKNNQNIEVTDFGAGSLKLKTKSRSIKDIARVSGSTMRLTKLMLRISNYYKPKHILELGTSLGVATHALALGNPEAKITTIEGCANVADFTRSQFKKFGVHVEQLIGSFDQVIPDLAKNKYDLIFFDGNHQQEATIKYFNSLLATANNNSLFIFDDIYWSKGMTNAWHHIKQHPKVTVTIDTYFWGFVFFRKEQQKEHFTIR